MKRFPAFCLSVLLIFAGTYVWANGNPPAQNNPPASQNQDEGTSPEEQKLAEDIANATRVFLEIQAYIQKGYYREVDIKECWDKVLAGGLAKCLDPNSSYISPSEVLLSDSETSGTFFGIGAEVSQDKDGRTIVISPIEGTPAWHAGLSTGDVITHVGENENKLTAIRGLTLLEVIKLIRGPKGVPVTLKVLRGDQEKKFTIVREEIVIVSVAKHDLGGRLGYVRVRQFQEKTADDFREALKGLRTENSCGAVLDFRNNPGGLLSVVIDMADLFSKKAGDIFITEKFRNGEREIKVMAPLGDFRDFPIAILINKGSASASEIFAGVLQDWGRPVIGVKSYGKGTIQQLIPLENGGVLRLTVAEYLVGNAKKPVHEIGVTPDYIVENPEQKIPDDPIERNKILNTVDPVNDPQLKKAMEVLGGLTKQCRNPVSDYH